VRLLRLIPVVIYASYLVNIGLLLILLPWTEGWSRLMLMIPPGWASILDNPALRGAVSAFGCLHVVLLTAELVCPVRAGSATSSDSPHLAPPRSPE
jgi:hypothetical protein